MTEPTEPTPTRIALIASSDLEPILNDLALVVRSVGSSADEREAGVALARTIVARWWDAHARNAVLPGQPADIPKPDSDG